MASIPPADSTAPPAFWSRYGLIAVFTLVMIAVSLGMRVGGVSARWSDLPLWAALVAGGGPLVVELMRGVLRGQFGADLLAGISIVVSILLGEYLAGAIVVLMLSGGEALEAMTIQRASRVLQALSRRMPSIAHRSSSGGVEDVPLDSIQIGDTVLVLPHEISPVDGTVVAGHGTMDESYLTGEPYLISKAPGSDVLSGAINGTDALTIRADKRPVDSRYARIMQVMAASAQQRPRMRRLADRLGTYYTPLALAVAGIAWGVSGEPVRFLAVLVVATPCPLLIAIPVAIIGAVSLAASRAIVIRDPACLETADQCRTLIFDKTGTLTYGRASLVGKFLAPGFGDEVLGLVGSLERFSKHPLATAIVAAAKSEGRELPEVRELSEKPGEGLRGVVGGKRVEVTSRKKLATRLPAAIEQLPPLAGGLECVVLIDDRYAATLQFRDRPRPDGASFVEHLGPRHQVTRALVVSGDRRSEVEYLADLVKIEHVYADQSPEQKLEIVRKETAAAPTIYVGDGINDAPALTAATIGIAFGQHSDVTSEAADAVILESSLRKVDEFLHISRRMRRIALQSAVGGIALSLCGMLIAAAGALPPVAGALFQEAIDIGAVLNALRASFAPRNLVDFESGPAGDAAATG
ncbi:MAG TPA: heavy metal translocating P-type ATPase [Caulifigura sp.]|nr:heavy metal translocating P-type ATPase [Caulifigura sp.]